MIYRGTGGGLVDMGVDFDIDIEVGEPLLVQIEG
jgi:hypothetical protein